MIINENFNKIIYIPLFSGQIARNILRTDVFKELQSRSWLKLIIFVPKNKISFYEKEFNRANVVFEALPEIKSVSKLDFYLYKLAYWFVDSKSISIRNYLNYKNNNRSIFYYYFKKIFVKVFGNIFFFKKIFRYFDYKMIKSDIFKKYFELYKPDLVFCPNVFGRYDLLLLREAKRRGVYTIGMIRSWDVVTTRGLLRVVPDKLIVHNNLIKETALKWISRDNQKIIVSGLPHFDYYYKYKPNISRYDFYKKFNIDINSKIILFSPYPSTNIITKYWNTLRYLDNAISSGQIYRNTCILVRFYPSEPYDEKEFKKKYLRGVANNIFFDSPGKRISQIVNKMDWDFDENDRMHLANSLFYSSLLINYTSSITLDSIAFGKPVINIYFEDSKRELAYHESFKWKFDHDHYNKMLKAKGTKLARSKNELVSAINLYLKTPEADIEGRKKILNEQCWKFDGKAGDRVAKIILDNLVKKNDR